MITRIEEKTEQHKLQCMEIWGGNRYFEDAVSVIGIDAWVLSKPHGGDPSGGDIHFVSMCAQGRISRFAVADVAGHGQAVSDLAERLRRLMRKNINRLDQTRFARALNREFAAMADRGQFATALLTSYFAPTDHLIVCNAGHPPPMWYRADRGTWQELVPSVPGRVDRVANLPLGVIEPTEYEQFAVELARDDLILIYTDSVIEATDDQGKALGEGGLMSLLGRLDVSDPMSLNRHLMDAVVDYTHGQALDDDLTLLLLHHNAADPGKPTLGHMVRMMGKMMGLG